MSGSSASCSTSTRRPRALLAQLPGMARATCHLRLNKWYRFQCKFAFPIFSCSSLRHMTRITGEEIHFCWPCLQNDKRGRHIDNVEDVRVGAYARLPAADASKRREHDFQKEQSTPICCVSEEFKDGSRSSNRPRCSGSRFSALSGETSTTGKTPTKSPRCRPSWLQGYVFSNSELERILF